MGNSRKRIPKRVETEVLEKCRRRCCICFGMNGDDSEKLGQIAHLDKNPANRSPGNLAFLCLPHHDRFDGRTSQSKSFSVSEVKRYRSQLWNFTKFSHPPLYNKRMTVQSVLGVGSGINQIIKHKKVIKKHQASPTSASKAKAEAQETRWGPVDGLLAGISINSMNREFVGWEELEAEIKLRILPQVKAVHNWSGIRLVDHYGKKNWIIQVLDKGGQEIGNIWFGPDPLKNWAYDGLVRVGMPKTPPEVWQVFRRYSDGSYRRQNFSRSA